VIFKRNKRVRATRVESLEEIEELAASGRPVLIDFWQTGCQPCRTMDGIVDELADEYRDTAHVTKVDVRRVPGAVEKFAIRSTPTFVLLATSSRAKKEGPGQGRARPRQGDPALARLRARQKRCNGPTSGKQPG